MPEDVSQQAQIISPINDPMTNDFSMSRAATIGATFFLTVGSATVSLFSYPNPIWVAGACVCSATVFSYLAFGRDEETLSHNLAKLKFKIRRKQGKEGMGKYNENATEKQVMSYIPWTGINENTGLSAYDYPNSTEYFGNWGFTAIAVAPPEVDRTAMNEGFRKAIRALPYGSSQKIILMTGIDSKFILNDIEELLKQPMLSPVRKAELLSMKKRFSQKMGRVDRTTLIHINVPYTVHEEIAQKQMNKIMNGYFKVLKKKGVKTVLIREHSDMIDIFQGMLTGKKIYGVA